MTKKVLISVDERSLAEIDRMAKGAGMSRSAYVVSMALGGDRIAIIEADIGEIQQRLTRLDELEVHTCRSSNP